MAIVVKQEYDSSEEPMPGSSTAFSPIDDDFSHQQYSDPSFNQIFIKEETNDLQGLDGSLAEVNHSKEVSLPQILPSIDSTSDSANGIQVELHIDNVHAISSMDKFTAAGKKIEPKRERCKNFTELEKSIFLEIISKYKRIVGCKKNDKYTHLLKAKYWKFITDEFNASENVLEKRETKALKNLYKKENANKKVESTKTCGGQMNQSPVRITEELSGHIEPLESPYDSSSFLYEDSNLDCDEQAQSPPISLLDLDNQSNERTHIFAPENYKESVAEVPITNEDQTVNAPKLLQTPSTTVLNDNYDYQIVETEVDLPETTIHEELVEQKRERGKNFTELEKSIFLEIISKYKRIVNSKKYDKYTLLLKAKYWKFITDEFNASENVLEKRETKALKNLYKKENANKKVESTKTCGGQMNQSPARITEELSGHIEPLESPYDTSCFLYEGENPSLPRETDPIEVASLESYSPVPVERLPETAMTAEPPQQKPPSQQQQQQQQQKCITPAANASRKRSRSSDRNISLALENYSNGKIDISQQKLHFHRIEHGKRMDILKFEEEAAAKKLAILKVEEETAMLKLEKEKIEVEILREKLNKEKR
ncbi:uncharacterized protein LOC111052104 [Nilaparvata lugens]|uniref:uncharacterized protein LOC111052104 n=1 Tax=Nilaparvata lugens TaxID=108931 RepID=UPI00193E50F8|nr:uncharacterized protein LOC111052104 [Nilaparvata lugens]